MDVLVTYDVDTHTTEGEHRLTRVAQVCESYGTRVQYSVFECRLSATRLEQLIAELAEEIDPGVDSICIYCFPGVLRDSRTVLGVHKAKDLGGPWIM